MGPNDATLRRAARREAALHAEVKRLKAVEAHRDSLASKFIRPKVKSFMGLLVSFREAILSKNFEPDMRTMVDLFDSAAMLAALPDADEEIRELKAKLATAVGALESIAAATGAVARDALKEIGEVKGE